MGFLFWLQDHTSPLSVLKFIPPIIVSFIHNTSVFGIKSIGRPQALLYKSSGGLASLDQLRKLWYSAENAGKGEMFGTYKMKTRSQ